MKRLFDLFASIVLLIILIAPMLLIAIVVRITSKGPSLYWSKRVGKDNIIFSMPKFRSMKVNSPVIATHLLSDPNSLLSPVGGFLRRSSLDELPQLYSILKGDMSFVGPRPALFNQEDLIELRKEQGVDALLPGITGWAQVNGRDELSVSKKVELDVEYMQNKSFWLDVKIIWTTILKAANQEGVSH